MAYSAPSDQLSTLRIKSGESEDYFRKIFENAAIGIVIADANRGYLAVNDRFCTITGYDRETLMTMGCHVLVHPDDQAADIAEVERLVRGEATSFSRELRYIHANGSIVPVMVNVSLLPGDVHEEIRILAVVEDITERKQAEEALKESENRFAAFMDNSPAIAWIKDEKSQYVYLSKPCETKLGLSDILGKTDEASWPPETAARFRRSDQEVFKTGNPHHYVEETVDKNGEHHFWLNNKFPLFSTLGKYVGGVGVEITKLKEAERRLQEKDDLLSRAQEMANVGHWERELPSLKGFWSDETYRIFGLKPQECEVHGRFFLERIHPEDRSSIEKAVQHLVEGAKPLDKIFRIVRPDSTIRWVRGKGGVSRTKDGKPVRIFGTILDITERKDMEDELRRSRDELEQRVEERTAQLHERLSEIEGYYDNVPVGIAILDRQLRHIRVNQKLAEINGIPPEAHIGRTVGEVADQGLADWLETMVPRILETGETIKDVERTRGVVGRPGIEITTRASLFPLKDPNGQPVAIGVALEDITERKRLEEELRQSHKMEAIGTLAGGIAHDFNNMLAIIMGNAELALDDVQQSEPRRNLEAILGASKRSRDLVKQILTFSRKSGGEQEALDMGSLLKETHTLLRSTVPTTIRIKLDIDAGRKLTVMGDPSKIQQVILNLAGNAAHAMREKGGVLTIGLSTLDLGTDFPSNETESGTYVKLTVKDTGTGIPDGIRSRIFEPFFTTKGPGQGTGMGLSVVYGIVKDLNGMIEVESKVGRGTLITVLFPQTHGVATDRLEHEATTPSGKEHILLVDDEAGFLEMTASMLKRLGYRVTSTHDSVIAMRLFTTSPEAFDLIITDQTMPDFTGIEFAREVRITRQDLPVILCTGYNDIVSPEAAKEAGVRKFLMKPIRKKELAQAIRSVLGRGKTVSLA